MYARANLWNYANRIDRKRATVTTMQKGRDLFLLSPENMADCQLWKESVSMTGRKRICRASSELLFSRDFLDRYNRYTKRQTTFPKEQESRNEFLSVLNYNPLSHTVHVVTSKLPERDTVLLIASKKQSWKNDSGVNLRSAICRLHYQDDWHTYYILRRKLF